MRQFADLGLKSHPSQSPVLLSGLPGLCDSVVLLVIFLFKSLWGLPALQTELRRTSVPELNAAGLESAGRVSRAVP